MVLFGYSIPNWRALPSFSDRVYINFQFFFFFHFFVLVEIDRVELARALDLLQAIVLVFVIIYSSQSEEGSAAAITRRGNFLD